MIDPSVQAAWTDRLVAEADPVLADWQPEATTRRLLRRWLTRQVAWCEDPAFAERFAAACPVEGAVPADYLQRVLDTPAGRVLVGIRFRGQDRRFPFVDLLAWEGDAVGGWSEVAAVIRADFASFRPVAIRVFRPEGTARPVADLTADQVWMAAPAPAVRGPSPPDPVRVVHPVDLAFFADYWDAMARFRAGAGPLGREVEPTDRDGFERCLDRGAVVLLRDGDRFAGVASAAPGQDWAVGGWVVYEELLDAPYRGRGLGPVLQGALAAALAPRGDRLLFGTIHHSNAPSLATARRCGRRSIGAWWFAAL